MNFYKCRDGIRNNLNENDIEFFHKLSLIAKNNHEHDVYSRVGYEVLGPMLLGYSQWLHRESLQFKNPMIVFLAREGKIFKRAYEHLYGDDEIKTVYINVSRVSMCRASMVYTRNFNGLIQLLNGLVSKDKTVRELFSIVGLDDNIYKDYPNLDEKLADIENRDELYHFIIYNGMTYFYNQNMLLKQYLAEKGITNGTVIVSDVGYSGSMQSLLSIITPEVRYAGRYMIARNHSNYSYKSSFLFRAPEMSGFWSSSPGIWRSIYELKRIPQYTTFFETLFLSTEGTTVGYVKDIDEKGTERVIPVEQYEKSKRETSECISKTHEAALKYIRNNGELITNGINPYVFFIPYINFAVFPGKETFSFFEKFSFIDGTTEKFFMPSKNRLYYLFHPKKWYQEKNLSWYQDVGGKRLLGKFFIFYRMLRFAKRHVCTAAEKLKYFFTAKHINKALRIAENYQVISFDIFDTLVKRKCSFPVHVFDLAEEKYNASHDDKIRSFRELRIQAEKTARAKSTFYEVTFDEIYNVLANEFGRNFAEEMKTLEIQAEFETIYPNEEVKRFYDLMKQRGKRIIITSDMYLSTEIIAEILHKCGYEGYEALYVSSEFKVCKSSGGLFRKIISDMKVNPSEILHIGDSFMSDYIMAERQGLKGFLYRK